MPPKRTRVLVVDDSALVRKIVTASLQPFADIEVAGTAPDAFVARDKLRTLRPDVMTLDVEMPRMDGLTFLRLLMREQPLPVIVFSSLTGPGSALAMEALQAGAVEVLGKPSGAYSAYEDGGRLAEKIRAAAQAKLRKPRSLALPAPTQTALALPVPPPPLRAPPAARPMSATIPPRMAQAQSGSHPWVAERDLILMGASTGGTEALREVLAALPGRLPGICIVQHIPAHFSRAFAERLNQICQLEVREARHGDLVKPGLALVAPGGYHLCLRRRLSELTVELTDSPPVHHQRPSVDVLFDSAVKAGFGPGALALLLTGMGADGARGMLALRQAGATTVAQNEETCVVFGMPREAIQLGAAQHIVPLERMALVIQRHFAGPAGGNHSRRPSPAPVHQRTFDPAPAPAAD